MTDENTERPVTFTHNQWVGITNALVTFAGQAGIGIAAKDRAKRESIARAGHDRG